MGQIDTERCECKHTDALAQKSRSIAKGGTPGKLQAGTLGVRAQVRHPRQGAGGRCPDRKSCGRRTKAVEPPAAMHCRMAMRPMRWLSGMNASAMFATPGMNLPLFLHACAGTRLILLRGSAGCCTRRRCRQHRRQASHV